MSSTIKYRFQLDTTSKKFNCQSCRQKTFVRVIDMITNNYLPEHVGACDRKNNCGYEYTAKQYLTDMGREFVPAINRKSAIQEPALVDFMAHDAVEISMKGYQQTNFAIWLIGMVGLDKTNEALLKYLVGRSKADGGKACIFWRIDKGENVRTGKVMCYDPITGKRAKDKATHFIHPKNNFNYKLCFFGEHLLTEYPDMKVGIVESEKTAIVASIFLPDMIWLATGGNSGCKWREWAVFNVLKNRTVIMYPDYGFYNKQKQITCYTEWCNRVDAIRERLQCNIKVSKLLEEKLKGTERVDFDIADMIIKDL